MLDFKFFKCFKILITCGFGGAKLNCLVYSKHSQARIYEGFEDKRWNLPYRKRDCDFTFGKFHELKPCLWWNLPYRKRDCDPCLCNPLPSFPQISWWNLPYRKRDCDRYRWIFLCEFPESRMKPALQKKGLRLFSFNSFRLFAYKITNWWNLPYRKRDCDTRQISRHNSI